MKSEVQLHHYFINSSHSKHAESLCVVIQLNLRNFFEQCIHMYLNRDNGSLSSLGKDLNYLMHLHHPNIGKWEYIFMLPENSTSEGFTSCDETWISSTGVWYSNELKRLDYIMYITRQNDCSLNSVCRVIFPITSSFMYMGTFCVCAQPMRDDVTM